MTGTFKLLFRLEPIGRATQVSTNGLETQKSARWPSIFGIDHPHAELCLELSSSTESAEKSPGKPTLN